MTATDAARYTAAIEIARAGRYAESLALITELRSSYPDSRALLLDEILVLSWAEDDERVQSLAATMIPADAPVDVRVAIGKSMRNLGRFDDAVFWYLSAVDSAPGEAQARIGLALAYADAGEGELARQALLPLREEAAGLTHFDLAMAYVEERAGRWLQAMASYDRVLATDPRNRSALRGKALVLRRLLLPNEALALAAAHPGILTDAEIERLRADSIALEVRYGTQVPYPVTQRHVMTDRAIAEIDASLSAGVADPQTELALRSDRIIALANRGSSAAAVAEFEALEARQVTLSAPVLAAVGKAYLEEREPRQARAALERAVALEPQNIDFRFALFYAHTELNDYDAALALAEQLASELPLTLEASRAPNPDRLHAEILVGVALAYADRLAEAQAQFERWLSEAPSNPDLRHELANVYRWRGWYDRSLFEYRQVLAVEPDLLEAQVGLAQTELDRSDFDAVASAVDNLNRDFGEEPAVARLTSQWALQNSSELRLDVTTNSSSGVTFGSDQHNVVLTWLSAPMENRYRAFASSREFFAEFPEGDSRRRRLAGGVRYQYGRWLASAEISGGNGGDVGARGSVDYRLSDYWLLSSAIEMDSDSVPLRGYRAGVESDLISVRARFAPNETLSVGFGAAFDELSDGNSRTQLSAEGRRRLINQSKLIVELIGEAFLGKRRTDEVPYFSPRHDAGALVGAELQWRALRAYEKRLTHVFRAELGSYDQAGYASSGIWRVAYMMPFELNQRFSTWLGVWRNRMHYDGADEYSTTISATVQFRF